MRLAHSSGFARLASGAFYFTILWATFYEIINEEKRQEFHIGQDISPIEVHPSKPIDWERAIKEFEGDEKFPSEVIEGFTKKVSEQIGTIRKALSCGDAETVRKEAHSIKGGAANLTAEHLSRVASELEGKGKSKELNGAGEIVDGLEREFKTLRRYVQENFQKHSDQ